MNTESTDRAAWEAHQSGKTWALVARELRFANGSVARRAALRHAARTGPPPTESASEVTPPVFLVDASGWGEIRMHLVEPDEPVSENANTPPDVDLALDAVIYHRGFPKAKFKFVKWNADGSLQVYGGEGGFAAYRDYHADWLSNVPSDGIAAIYVWAGQPSQLHTRVSVHDIALAVGARSSAEVRKAVRDRPDLFRRVKRDLYEIRDPKADRATDKAQAS